MPRVARVFDLGYGMPISLSSSFPADRPPEYLVPSSDPGTPFFRTCVQHMPTLTIDLQSKRHIQSIRIFNTEREDTALPMEISISIDCKRWSIIALFCSEFGGDIDDLPAVIAFRKCLVARYVRIQGRGFASLRLNYVEINSPLPYEYLGRLRNIRVNKEDVMVDYWHHDSYGFAWTFSCTLRMILEAKRVGICIDRISYRLCLVGFKDSRDDDAYEWLFESKVRTLADQPVELPEFDRHAVYALLPLRVLREYALLYFKPHARVISFAEGLIRSYGLDMSQTIVLLYRGTDKQNEVMPASPQEYVSVARSLTDKDMSLKVLIQTDQKQALDIMLAAYPTASYFHELPATSGDIAIHNLDTKAEFELNASQIGLRLLAMMWLVSQARYVVTHTGNLAAWVAIYRGRSDGIYQFCADGKLRRPSSVDRSIGSENPD